MLFALRSHASSQISILSNTKIPFRYRLIPSRGTGKLRRSNVLSFGLCAKMYARCVLLCALRRLHFIYLYIRNFELISDQKVMFVRRTQTEF